MREQAATETQEKHLDVTKTTAKKSTDSGKKFNASAVAAGKSLVQTETRAQGAVTGQTYLAYMRAGGMLVMSLAFVLFFIAMAVRAFSDYWLSYWLRSSSSTGKLNEVSLCSPYLVFFHCYSVPTPLVRYISLLLCYFLLTPPCNCYSMLSFSLLHP